MSEFELLEVLDSLRLNRDTCHKHRMQLYMFCASLAGNMCILCALGLYVPELTLFSLVMFTTLGAMICVMVWLSEKWLSLESEIDVFWRHAVGALGADGAERYVQYIRERKGAHDG